MSGPGELAPTRWSGTHLAIAAVGIVFGDIGTSPLYAMRECFGEHGVAPTAENVLGVLSLMLWSLTLVVAVKYLGFIMRADNQGEGGIFALLALIPRAEDRSEMRQRTAVVLLALFGAALLYGDGVITPAISVLSAVEGLSVATSAAEPLVVPITCVILGLLFLVQRRGTARIGGIFGPVMLLWFLFIAATGVAHIVQVPGVLAAVNPWYAVRFFRENGFRGFEVLGAAVLAITGGEALYADMGHFGRPPIRRSWFTVVFPALLLNYCGQGALLLTDTAARGHPFYALVPRPLLVPGVVLATLATIIASQALISGAFSLTRQAVQLGYVPRLNVVHTSRENEGQIYLPAVNQFLAVVCIALVLGFQRSSRLAAAYGIAVTGTMLITDLVFFFIVVHAWRWPLWKALSVTLFFLAIDVPYFTSNLLKFIQGGWVPVAVAVVVFACFTTWKRGRAELAERIAASALGVDELLQDLSRNPVPRVRGTAVFLSSSTSLVSPVLLHHLKHNQVLHEQVVLLSVLPLNVPEVPLEQRVEVEPLSLGFYRVTAKYGYRQSPRVPEILRRARSLGLLSKPETTSFYVGRETVLPRGRSHMAYWRKVLFRFISRNARATTDYFSIPPGRVVELGMQIDL
ncbi:MAG TPA: KUP/HAK/KT family potassium transporter [Myxococcaceae bacterium]|nr:KUP/HAK/KT family potassium transporter [Myxococcaceae bacterium]